jgi:CheY-like chemotaxis protein
MKLRVVQDEQGVALVLAMMAMTVLSLLTAVLLAVVVVNHHTTMHSSDARRAFGIAETGLASAEGNLYGAAAAHNSTLCDGTQNETTTPCIHTNANTKSFSTDGGSGTWWSSVAEMIDVPDVGAPVDAPRLGTETIMLVEDEAVVRRLVAEILETSGYTVLQAGDGPSALELLRRNNRTVDLLLTDVVMPGMSGREVAQAVTSMRPGTHVLYMSGYTGSVIDHHGILEQGVAFLQKPFTAEDLTRSIRTLLDGHE